jgi:hypothetical protein
MKSLGSIDRKWILFFGVLTGGTVTLGTHAQRTDLKATGYLAALGVAAGSLFIETDRGNVIYQSVYSYPKNAPATALWQFITGTMVGAQIARPTDLGVNDVGFRYSATDALDYYWNGFAWQTSDTVRGGASLADANRLTKVGASPGTLAESSITDDGTKVAFTELLNLDTGAAPSDSQLKLAANLLGALQLLCIGADQLHILFDQNWTGSTLIARNASIARLHKNLAHLNIRGAAGQTVGSAAADAILVAIDLATGDVGFGGNTAPAYPVDVTGNVNVGGAYYKGGAPGLTATIVTAKLTTLGVNGSMTFAGGILIGQVQAT